MTTHDKTLHILYFASLRDRSGKGEETLTTTAETPAQLYEELCIAYAFEMDRKCLRVAIDDAFTDCEQSLAGGETIVFIPPVAVG